MRATVSKLNICKRRKRMKTSEVDRGGGGKNEYETYLWESACEGGDGK